MRDSANTDIMPASIQKEEPPTGKAGSMTPLQFRIALIGKNYDDDQKAVLYRELVLGEPRQALIEETGVSPQWISYTVQSMLKNYAKRIDNENLETGNLVLTPDNWKLVRELEKTLLETRFPNLPQYNYPNK